jgi:hypothetical protein
MDTIDLPEGMRILREVSWSAEKAQDVHRESGKQVSSVLSTVSFLNASLSALSSLFLSLSFQFPLHRPNREKKPNSNFQSSACDVATPLSLRLVDLRPSSVDLGSDNLKLVNLSDFMP